MYIDTYFEAWNFEIPTDGDLRAYAWAIPVNDSPDFENWEEVLAYAPRGRSDQPFCRELVEVVKIAASTAVVSRGEATESKFRWTRQRSHSEHP
jgi:hypothetical protein